MKNNIIVMELKLYKISVHFNFICIFNKGFPGPDSKESAFSAGDQGSIPGFGRYPGEWQPTQKFLLENSMDRGLGSKAVSFYFSHSISCFGR